MEDAEHSERRHEFAVFFILLAEFGERFCFSGIRIILTLYLAEGLNYGESKVAAILHTFVFMTYCAPWIGAMIADSWLGKHKTIIWTSILYIFGVFVLSLGTMTNMKILKQPSATYLGMTIVAIAAGSYKPCSSSFGGDQFKLPGQEVEVAHFFSWFYWAISLGTFMSIALTPEMTDRFPCLKESSCYPLAYGTSGLFMAAALVIFICGTPFYYIREPETNVFLKFFGCITHALRNKFRNTDVKKDHWLDHASDSYDQATINDIKSVMNVMVLYLPLPLFWSLYELQFTGWYYQARLMTGSVANGAYMILPHQMQMTNPLAILILIPLFVFIFYPLLRKIHIGTPLQKMCVGMFLASIAFYVSGTIAYKIESLQSVEKMEVGYGQFRFYNTYATCDMKFTSSHITKGKEVIIKPNEIWANTKLRICTRQNASYEVKGCFDATGNVELREQTAIGLYFGTPKDPRVIVDDLEPHERGWAKVRFLTEYSSSDKEREYEFTGTGFFHKQKFKQRAMDDLIWELKPDNYEVRTGRITSHFVFNAGGIYVLLTGNNDRKLWVPRSHMLAKPEKLTILWQLPQNILLAAGEVMFAITGMEFAYTQAPLAMKAVMEAAFLLTYAAGNMIVVIIDNMHVSYKQSSNFYFYATVMIIDVIVFACLAMRYKYR